MEVSYLLVLRGDHAVRGGGLAHQEEWLPEGAAEVRLEGAPGHLLEWGEDRDVQECRDNPADHPTRAGSRNDFED